LRADIFFEEYILEDIRLFVGKSIEELGIPKHNLAKIAGIVVTGCANSSLSRM
jgi:hypothetical protein